MEQITIRLPEDLLDELEREAESAGVSRSEYIRDTLASREESERLGREIERLETELERARRERRQILAAREEHTDLVRAVERERSLEEARARASIVQRARWWLFGRDD